MALETGLGEDVHISYRGEGRAQGPESFIRSYVFKDLFLYVSVEFPKIGRGY